jgi:hypothetical protein
MTTPEIDYKTRRKLRMKLGSRVGRRAGTKSRRKRRVRGAPTAQTKPRVRLNEAIRAELERRLAEENADKLLNGVKEAA